MHCSFKREKFIQTKINGTAKAEIIYKNIMEQNYVKHFELNWRKFRTNKERKKKQEELQSIAAI